MSTTTALVDAAGFCAELVRSRDFARYAATLFVPAIPRRALLALYAFNAEISRVREQVSQPLPGEMRLQWWTDMLQGAGHGGIEGNPVAAELLLAIRDFRLPVEPLSRLIDEHQFDLYNDPMPSMAALEGYVTAPCRHRPGHRAGDCGAAARCCQAATVRAAAIAGKPRQRH
jgi:phytoene synthase